MNSLVHCRSVQATITGVALMIAAVVAPHVLLAADKEVSSSYQLQPVVVGVGGLHMQGIGGWSLDGTVGQVDAIVQNGAGGLQLDGGFWHAAAGSIVVSDRIFANGFELPSGEAPKSLGKP
jgi:hypothetical protein